VYNDIVREVDRGQLVLLVLLNLSSAFDTVDHMEFSTPPQWANTPATTYVGHPSVRQLLITPPPQISQGALHNPGSG